MSKSKKAELLKAKTFLTRLQATVQCLPTEAERAETLVKVKALADFLATLKNAVGALPTADGMAEVNEALRWLQGLMAKAEASPALAGLAGGRRASRGPRSKPKVTEAEVGKAELELGALKQLPVDEIRARLLEEDRYPSVQLRAIASVLGIRSTEKMSRESMVHQIAANIANYRGYEALCGRGDTEPPSSGGLPTKG